jgi:hypothetical protein
MRDPLDSRPDAYALLECAEDCKGNDARRKYTSQLARRAAGQSELQAAREILTRNELRLAYDLYRYNLGQDLTGGKPLEAPRIEVETPLPLEISGLNPEWIDMAGMLAQIPLEWAAPLEPVLVPVAAYADAVLPNVPIEFDK